ncbi:MAG: HU family DNA-binding protein [Firmicutes bacterium]|nr:HU family DNA-binding protein [Bacillota bacterium]MCL2771165.1 HU family DNA-binding protein [Bacillota bacterium]
MNKSELAKRIGEKSSLTKKEATEVIDILTTIISESVKRGEAVNIVGFGKFGLKYRKEREAYNPFTKKISVKAAHKVPVFKSYKKFKEQVNSA